MGGNQERTQTRTGYCPFCERQRAIYVTVPWQDDVCRHCSNPVPSDEGS